jgi:hypothetical protein
MSGGIVQLALWGAEDIPLSSQPQVTWFKTAFRRSTPFSMDSIEQQFQGEANFAKRSSINISRSGDLCTDVWLQIKVPSLWNYFEPYTQQASTPVIKAARYTSSTSAKVIVEPSITKATSITTVYKATVTPVGEGSTVTSTSTLSDPYTILVTGLVATSEYNVVVETMIQATENASPTLDPDENVSASTEVIALKWANSLGHAIMESVAFSVGATLIDRHTSDYLDMWSELTLSEEKKAGVYEMVGKYDDYDPRDADKSFDTERLLMVPMQFFFCTSPSMALPILSLTYHESRLDFQFRDYKDCIRSTRRPVSTLLDASGYPMTLKEMKCYATQVYLDVEERRRYSNLPQEMLVTVTQFLGDAALNVQAGDALTRKIPIEFSHPVKEIIWAYNPIASYTGDSTTIDWFNYGDDDFFDDLKISINGVDRNISRPAPYYRLIQPYAHHTRIPKKKVYSFSFALHPEQIQGSGTINMSRCDTAHLVATMKPTTGQGRLRVYCTSFNVFRVANGLGGLSFSG